MSLARIVVRQVHVILLLASATGILAADETAPKPEKFAIWPNDTAPIGAGDSEKDKRLHHDPSSAGG